MGEAQHATIDPFWFRLVPTIQTVHTSSREGGTNMEMMAGGGCFTTEQSVVGGDGCRLGDWNDAT